LHVGQINPLLVFHETAVGAHMKVVLGHQELRRRRVDRELLCMGRSRWCLLRRTV
jgi:hypothetical protein